MPARETTGDGSSGRDALTSRDRLVVQIVDQVARQGYFMAHVPAQPAQGVIDLRWAAQSAGRALGRRMQTCTRELESQHVGLVTVIAMPVDATASTIDRLGSLHANLLQRAPLSA